jgi:serine/threonine-protein kinase HipA
MASSHLNVFLHNTSVGTLIKDRGELSFEYNPSYLKQDDREPLSSSLPLSADPFDHQKTYAFFSGLLPDESVRIRLSRYLHVSPENTFGLLEIIGGDCAGAVSLYKDEHSPNVNIENDFKILNDLEAYDLLSSLNKHPLMAGDEGIRISGAGAQDKMMAAFIEDKLAIPRFNTPSTHIIKPEIKDLNASVHNEFFCMQLASNIGLNVAQADIYWLKNHPFYRTKRYDRTETPDNRIKRLHQEDFCQALKIPPEEKYENEGGPSLAQSFALLDHHIHQGLMPGVDKINLIDAVIFNFLIGNGDAHGKNFSLLYRDGATRLAPLYDLLCTRVYTDSPKDKMAMKIGGKYEFREIYRHQLHQLAGEINVKPALIDKRVQKIARATHKEAAILMTKLNQSNQTKSSIYEEIVKIIDDHQDQLFL